jgi:hypothetical protein
MAFMHLIHFPDRAERLRALDVFLDVPATRLLLPGHRMVVTNEHIKALERANIAFEYISQTQANGHAAAPDQS